MLFDAKFLKKHKQLLTIVAIAFVLYLLHRAKQTKENYHAYFGGECYDEKYYKRQIYLTDMSGGMSTGQAYLEKKCKKLFVNVEAVLPYARGGVFISLDGIYNVYIINKDTGKKKYIGTLNREDFRVYYLKAVLDHPFEYHKHGIMVTRKTRNHREKPILVGF